jgi:hypothetical protein
LEEHISASTQNQALSALLFLYRHVLNLALGPIDSVRARLFQHVLNRGPNAVRGPLDERCFLFRLGPAFARRFILAWTLSNYAWSRSNRAT